jgi:plastocyanin domain-containing protein
MSIHGALGSRSRAALAILAAVAVVGWAGCGRTAKQGASAGAQQVRVKVTENGFEPAQLAVAAGRPIQLTITRETEQTCATRVVFASLNLKKDLPLNQPVTIDLPAQPAGTIAYACGMDMVKGALIVH